MSDRSLVGFFRAHALAAGVLGAVAAGATLGLASPAAACTAVAPQVALCTDGTDWALVEPQHHDAGVVWEGEDFWLEFNPAMTDALAAMGGGAAALDAVIAQSLEGGGARGPRLELRDRFVTDSTVVERAVVRLGSEGSSYLSAVLLTEFAGGGPWLVWSAGSVNDVPVDDLLSMIATAAASLRLGTED